MCRTTFHVYCMVCGISKHFNVLEPKPEPKPKPKPAPTPKATPQPGPKGQHRQVFRMVYHRKKGFRTSRTLDHSMLVGRHTTAQSGEIQSFGVHLSVGKERARIPRSKVPEFFFPRYRAAHGRAQEPAPGSAVEHCRFLDMGGFGTNAVWPRKTLVW